MLQPPFLFITVIRCAQKTSHRARNFQEPRQYVGNCSIPAFPNCCKTKLKHKQTPPSRKPKTTTKSIHIPWNIQKNTMYTYIFNTIHELGTKLDMVNVLNKCRWLLYCIDTSGISRLKLLCNDQKNQITKNDSK